MGPKRTSTVSKHKRNHSDASSTVTLAKRPRRSLATPVKSQYFEGSDDELAGEDDDSASEASNPDQDEESDFDDDEESDFDNDEQSEAATEQDEDSPEEESDDDDDVKPKRKKAGRPSASSTKVAGNADVWKPGVKTGLGPGKQVIIKKPKARPAGDIPYTEETIHPNTLLFLGDLRKNNNREWLKLHDPDFRASEKDWYSFVEKITEKLMEADETIPELPLKDVIFRIYRDVRFSKDPTPYKIGQKNSFIGGGVWHPEAGPQAALRRAVDRNPKALKDVLRDDNIRAEFLEGAKKTDESVVKAFVKSNKENALKTKPKGYDADHVDIDLLRLRNYTIGRKLTDEEVLGATGASRVAHLLGCLTPFITYLNSVVMPDEADDSGSDDDDDDEEDNGDASDSAESSDGNA